MNRNDPCPCNSGKKYKKCCMLKEYAKKQQEEQQEEQEWQEWFKNDCAIGEQNLKDAYLFKKWSDK